MKYFIAALCLVFAGAAYGDDEQAVVVRDKNNKFYLVTYDCGTPAVRAWLRGAAQVGDLIRIRDKRDQNSTLHYHSSKSICIIKIKGASKPLFYMTYKWRTFRKYRNIESIGSAIPRVVIIFIHASSHGDN